MKRNISVPDKFKSDGCTLPSFGKRFWVWLLTPSRYEQACRRHDFECRYSIYPWWSANWFFVQNIWSFAPWYLKWQAAIYFIGVTIGWRRCKYTVATLPDEWRSFIDRKNGDK